MKLNKAAMFGLDARIALAIFGALSVISGAALYSAIQQSKVTALVTSIKEQEKAFEQYFLDTGQHIPFYTTGYTNAYNYNNLFTNVANVDGWNGPYISNDYDDSDQRFQLPGGYKGLMATFEHDDWGVGTAGADIACSSGDLCAVFVEITTPGADIAKAVELAIDGTADDKKGKVRFHPDLTNPSIYYRTNITYTRD
tara:strand:+ start:421 stop:1011 length:591 start_codon:yes stop_codon:yes gene_type:complete